MSISQSEIFSPLEEADDFAAEAWPDHEDVVDESAWDTEEDTDWEDYPADEADEDIADEVITDEGYPETEYDEADYGETPYDEADYGETAYDEAVPDLGELDTYHRIRRAPRAGTVGSPLAASAAQIAEQEYQRWRPGGGKSLVETDRAATPILQDYYRTGVGMNVSARQLQSKQWQQGHPWSAVFISWVMKKAGAGAAFTYSPAHQNYIRAARRNRLTGNTANPFWAFRVSEIAPQVGDLVCTARENSGATYDNIAGQSRKTHCDIVTQVRPGEIRVIGGNVRQNVDAKTLRTGPDGRLRLDGKQSGYFAIIRCNDTAVPAPVPPQPTPRPAPGPAPQVRASTHVVERFSLLRDHAGTPPDLVLKWNDMAQPTAVDVVVHLHGWSPGVGRRLNILRHKLPASGLDFADPKNSASIGRTTPTLMILPRGHHDPVGNKTERYTFPALVNPGALQRLIHESLAIFAAQTGVPVRRNRLILTAHSGGGAPLMKILGHTDPDEVHTFDALYTDPTPLITWAQRRMASGSGALRVIYRPGEGTAAYSKRVARTIAGRGSPSFRVESTGVSHNDIPPRFGWRLLADPSADLPGVALTREADDEFDFESEGFDHFDETDEADVACAQFAEADDEWGSEAIDEWSTEADYEDIADEVDEDHAEEASVHDYYSEDEEADDEVDMGEATDSEQLAELVESEFGAADDESPEWDEEATDEPEFEEFGGAEHKHLGDQASGNAHTTIRYGSPPQWLSFGDVVSMAGDYFESYFDMNELARTPEGRMELAWARWHCLGLKAEGVAEPTAPPARKKAVTDRYFALASRNLSHFSAGGNAAATYAKWHSDALVDALEAGQSGDKAIWRRALTKEAFADHFLTDAFSAGHVRTPRADIKQWYDTNMPGSNDALLRYMARFIFNRLDERQQLPPVVFWYGWISRLWGNELLKADISKTGGEATNTFSVGDIISLSLHNFDNKGLDVVSAVDADGRKPAGGYRWRAVGDGHLGLRRKSTAPPRPNRCAPVFSAASGLTTRMATAAVVTSLRDLERVRGVGVKLGKRQLNRTESVGAIKQGVGAKSFPALEFVPRADAASNRNSPLKSASGSASLDWRWGRLGDVAYRAVDETVKCQIADDLEGLIPSVADPAIAQRAGMTFRIYGTRNAFRAFVKHLQTSGIKAIEDAVGKAAR